MRTTRDLPSPSYEDRRQENAWKKWYGNIPARFSLQPRLYVAMTTPFLSHFCTL